MGGDKEKRVVIPLSSSSDDDSDDDRYDFCAVSSDSSSYSSDDECELIDDDDDEEDWKEVEDDEQALYNQVIRFLQEKRDLQELSVRAFKAYLRRNGLRLSGNKNEFVQRVQEHWRIKDGKAEVLYPRSSFSINCKGDVCKGDTVLFTQKVFGSFDKVKRNGKLLGRRTVAGRVVKESYGAAKQQHTFTVEVLWTKGMKKLPPLFPLLVKGRNLYRLNTFRQRWKNEIEREKVLREKHRRGATARLKRVKRRKGWSTDKGSQKLFKDGRPSNISCFKGARHFDRRQEVSNANHSTTNRQNQYYNVEQRATEHMGRPELSRPLPIHQDIVYQSMESHHRSMSFHPANVSQPLPRYQYIAYPTRESQHRSMPFHSAAAFQPLSKHQDKVYLSRESHHRSMAFHSAAENFMGEFPYHGRMEMPAAQYDAYGYKSYNSFHY